MFPNCKIINENYTELEDGKKIEGLSGFKGFNIPPTVEVPSFYRNYNEFNYS